MREPGRPTPVECFLAVARGLPESESRSALHTLLHPALLTSMMDRVLARKRWWRVWKGREEESHARHARLLRDNVFI